MTLMIQLVDQVEIEMTNERTEYVEKLMKFVIGEEVKVERTKGQKDTTPVLGTGHLADGKGTTVKEGKREYASGNISKKEDQVSSCACLYYERYPDNSQGHSIF